MIDFKKMFGNRIYILAAFTLVGLFSFLSTIPGMKIVCTDEVCDGFDCVAYCNVTNMGSRSVYIYNYDDWTMSFSPEVEEFDLFVKYYGKWRYTNFTMETRLGNIPDDRKYVFVFPKYSKKEFKLVVKTEDAERIKYTFGTFDPFLISWKVLYENVSINVEDYSIVEKCVESEFDEENKTWSKAYCYNDTFFTGYKNEWVDGKKIGLRVGDKNYSKDSMVLNKSVHTCKFDQADRDWDKYPVRQWEIDKGICDVIIIE